MHAIEETERAAVGDVIVVGGHFVGNERTTGEILEVRGSQDHERYRVRWEDGHESIFHPADGDATIRHYSTHSATAELVRILTERKIAFEALRHPRTQTALSEAEVLHASGDEVGKTVVVHTTDGMIRAVIAAPDRLSLAKLRELFGHDVRLATEDELGSTYPGFELGAVPPFGGPKDDSVVVDERLAKLDWVIVEAGSHSDSLRLAPADLVRLTAATVADVVVD